MSDRYEPIPPSQLSPEQQKAHDEATKFADDMFGNKFTYKNKEGALIGPFAPLIYTPNLVSPYFQLVVELSKVPGFPAKAKETAILATGSVYKASFELYAHGRIAESTVLNKRQVEALKSGVKPSGEDQLDEQSDAAFDVAIELAKGGGPLSKDSWDKALKALGKEGAAALIHFVGIYAYTCIILNGVDASVPED